MDHFIPGLGVDPATQGSGAHLALTYYFYPNAACTPATCQLDVGFVSSPDGGATWSAPTQLAGPMSLADIAATSQGPMVGDYISTSFNATGSAATVFAIGKPHTGAVFDEGMWAPSPPLAVATPSQATRAGDQRGRRERPGRGSGSASHRASLAIEPGHRARGQRARPGPTPDSRDSASRRRRRSSAPGTRSPQ